MTSDRELATRVAVSGDAEAFTLLVERHQLPIRRFLRRLAAGDDAAADDLAQETFLTAYQKMHTFKGTAKLGTWLHTIAYRHFINQRRKLQRQQVMAEVPDSGQDTRQAIDDEILAQQLLRELGPEDRACLTLSYAVGMSHAEISEVVEKPLGSVKARIHRAKGKLQIWLKEHDHPIQTQTPKEPENGGRRHA